MRLIVHRSSVPPPPALRPLLLALPLLAAGPAGAAEPAAAAGVPTSLWDLIVVGGWAMWPLGLCQLGVLFLLFHSWRETRPARFLPCPGEPSLAAQPGAAAAPDLAGRLAASGTVLGECLAAGLGRVRPGGRADRAAVEAGFLERLDTVEGDLAAWINYLNVLATIAPMIGLLGTVSGMIGAFQTISAGGMGRPELLAGDIGEALITTAAGLIIGIPAMFAYYVFRGQLNRRLQAVTQSASDWLAAWAEPANASPDSTDPGKTRRPARRPVTPAE